MTTKLGPASQKQADFLNSKADITIFGGAANHMIWQVILLIQGKLYS